VGRNMLRGDGTNINFIPGVHLPSGSNGKLLLINCSSWPTGISCAEGVVTM